MTIVKRPSPLTIELITPAPPGSLHGNRVTAQRWQGFLKKLGYQAQISEYWAKSDADLLVALHAYRSHLSIIKFREAFPNKPIVLIMTGTDLYRDLSIHPEVFESMKISNAIVVLQPAAVKLIPKDLQSKVHVVYQSTKPIQRKPLLKKDFLVTVIGHLRPEKDPFCIARSLEKIPSESNIKVIHLGKAMSADMERMAEFYSADLERYQWLNELSHAQTMQQLSRCHLMVISSLMEGGAHVVTEAIAIGVPIIASDIPGNRGLLGDDYPGYYKAGVAVALAKVLLKAETDASFYKSLKRHIKGRSKYVQPQFEMKSIKALINNMIK